MISTTKIAALMAVATCVMLAGCAAEATDMDAEQVADPALTELSMDSTSRERVGEAVGAQCLPGYVYVAAVNACVAYPYTIDRTPGAFGCPNGGIISAHGRVFCLPIPHGIAR
ncbi:hypothetical protein [Sorangium sp. So ce1097]|uniref:hypothetical protein n=1 Tax=Sorangium sp. So ce1097 TaxID=3133330 RepID=UPI003F63A3D8